MTTADTTTTGARAVDDPPLELPARERLAQIVRSLAAALPGELGTLLAAPRFRDGAAALARLGDPAHLERALAATDPREAAWLADRLLARWRRLGPPRLLPAVGLAAPELVWIGAQPVEVPVRLVATGLAPGWRTTWEGAEPGPDAAVEARALVEPPAGDDDRAPHLVRARVHARASADDARCILVAEALLERRRPVVALDLPGRRLGVTDQHGRPAAGVHVAIGRLLLTTDQQGAASLPPTLDEGALIRVEGIPAGRV